MNKTYFESPVGCLMIEEHGAAITGLSWEIPPNTYSKHTEIRSPLLNETVAQLGAYFQGKLKKFSLPLHVEGSDFQQKICVIMSDIPFGETRTYGEIAQQTNNRAQAVGNACGANPIPIIIPCHRVLGAQGLGGFSGGGGVETKVKLLRLEGAGGLLI